MRIHCSTHKIICEMKQAYLPYGSFLKWSQHLRLYKCQTTWYQYLDNTVLNLVMELAQPNSARIVAHLRCPLTVDYTLASRQTSPTWHWDVLARFCLYPAWSSWATVPLHSYKRDQIAGKGQLKGCFLCIC